ncbi:hypothetical protein EV385_3432 [Krasilnikovia cinnamomea]|uniref:Type VII secretion system (Wss) protein ESAT-6 n=1 Tax=Krasilnikovia cinnamomea TaxID=349313 RepID=A0A4Q7ZLV2_9ACTN|nr:hypothetical protein [Krasilnikovia cinnamomea]RZU51601.1 hypothetical protein EV385_3432 [Krasilnikovia cinnamomea]
MPIDTRIDGDPASIRATATWLRGRLAASLDQSVDDLFAARDQGDGAWRGDAGPAFTARMDSAGRKSDALRGDVERVAQGFNRYADDLATAQAGMERARGIARDAGLQLAGDVIMDPGPAPALTALPTDRAPTPEMVQAHNSSVTAYNAHQDKVAAYAQAQDEAKRSSAAWDAAKGIYKNMADDVRTKPLLVAADVVNGAVVGGLAQKHVSILRKQADAFMEESKTATQRYLNARGGSPEALRYNQDAYQRYLDADKYTRRADSVARRVGSKIPIVGLGITAAGIGYDVHQGKPVGKAVISGVGGALAAAGTGALIGTAFGGPVGTVAGAVIGAGVGIVTSGALDYAYDELPEGTKAAIEDGFAAIGDAGAAIGDGAKKVWDSIF